MKCITAPIAVFDSGVGGIGVLRELQKALPAESFLYFGDCANAPYGEKPQQLIKEIVLARAARLLCRAKALVLACNTATSVAGAELRARTDLPVIGMEPALSPALRVCPHPRVLVLATEPTLAGAKFRTLMKKADAVGGSVTALAAPGMVRLAEAGAFSGDAPKKYLSELLAPYREVRFDAVVLGCTHFPFLAGELRRALGYPVPFFDGAAGTARETKRRLAAAGLLRDVGFEEGAEGGSATPPESGDPQRKTRGNAGFEEGAEGGLATPPESGDPQRKTRGDAGFEEGAEGGSATPPESGDPQRKIRGDAGFEEGVAGGSATPPESGDPQRKTRGDAGFLPHTALQYAPRGDPAPFPACPGALREPPPPAWSAGRVLITGSAPEKLPLMQMLYRFGQKNEP